MNQIFTILLVDDIKQNLDSLTLMILDEFDVKIEVSKSAEEAIAILMKKDINLILSDIQMPDIDGFEFTEYLKGIEQLKEIPVILITGIYGKEQFKQRGYDLGAVEYITKPIDNELFTSKLRIYINLFEDKLNNQQEIRKKNEIIIYQSKMAAMGEMIGVIAHQLKQPLNVLSLFCQDVKSSFEFNEIDEVFVKDFDENTKNQIQFLSKTIDNFRDFFDPNKVKQEFSIEDTVNKMLFLLEKQLTLNEVNISLDIQEKRVFGIESEFSQVILNLITNAQDALIQNNIKNKMIKIKTYKQNEKIVFSIEDNAGGIPEKIKDKIFNPYFTTKQNGTGVGLYMVKLVVESSFRSHLDFNNTKEGVIFTINLPLNESEI